MVARLRAAGFAGLVDGQVVVGAGVCWGRGEGWLNGWEGQR